MILQMFIIKSVTHTRSENLKTRSGGERYRSFQNMCKILFKKTAGIPIRCPLPQKYKPTASLKNTFPVCLCPCSGFQSVILRACQQQPSKNLSSETIPAAQSQVNIENPSSYPSMHRYAHATRTQNLSTTSPSGRNMMPVNLEVRLSVADTYFYTELLGSLGSVEAEKWLKSRNHNRMDQRPLTATVACTNLRFAASGSPSHTPPSSSSALSAANTSRHTSTLPVCKRCLPNSLSMLKLLSKHSNLQDMHDHISTAACPRQDDCTAAIGQILQENGDKVGLLFTDAAHELLDSPSNDTPYLLNRWLLP